MILCRCLITGVVGPYINFGALGIGHKEMVELAVCLALTPRQRIDMTIAIVILAIAFWPLTGYGATKFSLWLMPEAMATHKTFLRIGIFLGPLMLLIAAGTALLHAIAGEDYKYL